MKRIKKLAVTTSLVSLTVVVIAGLAIWSPTQHDSAGQVHLSMTPAAALAELRTGNQRFMESHRTRSSDTRHDDELRQILAKGQHPLAAVLCCSDSRVCPEFIFDQRIGTLFEIRNAGNVVDEDVLASLEYAVEHLHVPLIVILGHKGCGAVEVVCKAQGRPLHDHLRALQSHMSGIQKLIIESHHRHDADVMNRLALENAKQQALTVMHDSDLLNTFLTRGDVKLIYGLYDMETGAVEFFDLPDHP